MQKKLRSISLQFMRSFLASNKDVNSNYDILHIIPDIDHSQAP